MVTPTEVLETAVAVKDGQIVALGAEAMLPPAERTIDATGKYVLPGLIDCHVHLGAVYDDWHTGPVAAAHAGLTTLLSFVEYDDQARETLPQALKRLRDEAGQQSVVDFGFHFILNNQPYILDGLAEAFEQGVTSYKIFMTYKRRPNRMCSDEFIAQVMEKIAALGGVCQLHCENGDILYHLENKSIAAGRVKPDRLPGHLPAVDRGGGDQPRHPHRRDDQVPGLRRPPLDQGRARADQGGAGPRPARVDRDVPAVHAAHREGDGGVGPARQDRPAAPPGRRRRRRRALGRQPRGLHRHGGQRPLAAPQGAEGAGLEEHLRGRQGQPDPVRQPVHRDAGAAHVERGRGEARPPA